MSDALVDPDLLSALGLDFWTVTEDDDVNEHFFSQVKLCVW